MEKFLDRLPPYAKTHVKTLMIEKRLSSPEQVVTQLKKDMKTAYEGAKNPVLPDKYGRKTPEHVIKGQIKSIKELNEKRMKDLNPILTAVQKAMREMK